MAKSNDPFSLEVGGVLIKIQHRNSRGDGGLTFDVFASEKSNHDRLLRFDCFKKNPHFHLGKRVVNDINRSETTNPVQWTLTQLKTRLSSMIEEAGYKEIAARVDQRAVAESLSQVEKEPFISEEAIL